MKVQDARAIALRACGLLTAAISFALLTSPLSAQEVTADPIEPASPLLSGDALRQNPLGPVSISGSFAPATETSDSPALALKLDQPFSLDRFGEIVTGQLAEQRVASSNLRYRVDDQFSVNGGLMLQQSVSGFQSLGSIQCQNGVLDAVSYRASNCFFIDDNQMTSGQTLFVGSEVRPSTNSRAALNLFQTRTNQNVTSGLGIGADLGLGSLAALADPLDTGVLPGSNLIGPNMALPLGMRTAASELTGIDVEFEVGFSTDQAGDLVLGLQLTRVLDSGMEGVFYTNPGVRNWTIAEPFDSARLSLDWHKGSFSGGVDSYYRSPLTFLDRSGLESQASFDVHFTWRAPWNASLSVGASNVLGAGADEPAADDSGLVDPLESIYGRIPYVRYKQDL